MKSGNSHFVAPGKSISQKKYRDRQEKKGGNYLANIVPPA
jgi:hypothetical protein